MTAPKHRAEDRVFSQRWTLTEEQLDRTMEQLKGEFEPAFWDALVDARLAGIDETSWNTEEFTVRRPGRGWSRETDLIATVAVEPWTPALGDRKPGRRAA